MTRPSGHRRCGIEIVDDGSGTSDGATAGDMCAEMCHGAGVEVGGSCAVNFESVRGEHVAYEFHHQQVFVKIFTVPCVVAVTRQCAGQSHRMQFVRAGHGLEQQFRRCTEPQTCLGSETHVAERTWHGREILVGRSGDRGGREERFVTREHHFTTIFSESASHYTKGLVVAHAACRSEIRTLLTTVKKGLGMGGHPVDQGGLIHVGHDSGHVRLVGSKAAYEETVGGGILHGCVRLAAVVGERCHEARPVTIGQSVNDKGYVMSEALVDGLFLKRSYQHLSQGSPASSKG